MDRPYPYVVNRQDAGGIMNQAGFRIVTDAINFARHQAKEEVSPCLWWVKNIREDFTVARFRYHDGQVIQEV